MADNTSIPIIVQGNSYSLAIPLQIYEVEDDEMVLVDYTPDETDNISIQLKGTRRSYTYSPTSVDDNVVSIQLGGYELADIYAVKVTIVKNNGERLRSFRTDQFFIVESSDDLTTDDIVQGLEENVIYLDASIFIQGPAGPQGPAGADGADGYGYSNVSSPTPPDGTAIITLTNGDTMTIDLNHNHDVLVSTGEVNRIKFHICADETAYNNIVDKDANTLYLIKESGA